MLDTSALSPTRILLLDTFFHIVIWYGSTIVSWRNERLHERPEYSHLAQLLQAPINDAKALMERRFPTPRFIECIENGSQARFLIAKLNPSLPSRIDYTGTEQPIFTEDVSLKVFLQHLKKLVVDYTKAK
uniref:Protein transport protein SEC23 n=1 Tax=Lygus hesperus TaxID=30085 RepID=A0A0A9WVJ7_LYGHE